MPRSAAVALAALATAVAFGADVPPRYSGSPPVQVWRIEDQGASAINWRVLVHPATGFIYAANNNGVLEFDGVRWRVIPLPHGGSVRTLAIATDGRVWAGGSGQIVVLEPEIGADSRARSELRAVDMGERLPENPPPPSVADAAAEPAAEEESESGLIDTRFIGVSPYAVAAPDGVYFLLRRTVVRFRTDNKVDVWRKPGSAVPLAWWSDGALHVAFRVSGVNRLGADGFKPSAVPGQPRVLAVDPHPGGGTSWLTDAGPARWDGAAIQPGISAEAAALFRGDRPRCAAFLPDGGFAFGTTNHGVVILDRAGRLMQVIDRERGLPANRVNGLAVDGEGGLCLAMHAGLVRVQLDTPLALHGTAQGLGGSPRRLARAGDRLYVTHGEGLSWRDDRTGRFTAVPGFRSGANQITVADDHVLVTGVGLALVRPDAPAVTLSDNTTLYGIVLTRSLPDLAVIGSANRVSPWSRVREEVPGRPAGTHWQHQDYYFKNAAGGADDLYDDGRGFVWLVTRTARVGRLDLRAGPVADAAVEFYGPVRGLPAFSMGDKMRVHPIGGDLFALSARGAWRYNPTQDRFVAEPRLSVAGAGPVAIAPTADGAWLFYAQPEPRLQHVTIGAGGDWKLSTHPVPALDGFVVNSIYLDAPARTLWIAAQGQLVSYDLDWHAIAEPVPPRVMLRRVLGPAGEALWVGNALHAKSSAPAPAALTLPPEHRAVRLEFTAPAFRSDLQGHAPQRFRTRVSGIDRAWTPWSEEARRDLTNLPDGDLTVDVQARDLSGRESAVARLALHVLPPWWRTGWAFAGFAATFAAGMVGIVKLRTRTHRQRAAQLEAIVAERTGELHRQNQELAVLRQLDLNEKIAARLAEEKAQLELLRYQLNPHFLFNALNSVRALVLPRPSAARDMVTQLGEFFRSTLTRGRRGTAVVTLGEELAMLANYLEIEKSRWETGLDVGFDVEEDVRAEAFAPFLLLPLVENAVKYGGQTSRGVLRIAIVARREGGGLWIEVANTGRWIAPTEPRPNSTGIGLENLRRRLSHHYPDAHVFTTESADGWVRVRLQLAAPPREPNFPLPRAAD